MFLTLDRPRRSAPPAAPPPLLRAARPARTPRRSPDARAAAAPTPRAARERRLPQGSGERVTWQRGHCGGLGGRILEMENPF